MKRISKFFIVSLLAISPTASFAQRLTPDGARQKINEAVLNVYNEEIQADSRNYNAYFRRAHLYYDLNQYKKALSDVDNAIKYAPTSDKDLLSQAYGLRANIYLMLKDPANALPDLDKAYAYDTSSYALLYQKANAEYEVGKLEAAKADYQKLAKMNNRSLESLIGLARVAVMENNLGLANDYADQAVALYPTDADVFLRRASVRRLIGNNTGAVDDILLALSLSKNNQKAISELVDMSHTDYNAVITALTKAIAQAPNNGVFYYIRARIAQGHYHFLSAIADYELIIKRNFYNHAGIYASLAECYYALCDFQKALEEINYAIAYTTKNAPYYAISSRIHLALGSNQVAMMAIDKSLDKIADNPKAVFQKAICEMAIGEWKVASEILGENIVISPNDPQSYLVRAWILKEKLKDSDAAASLLARCVELDYPENSVRSLKGFALNLLGQNEEARAWMDAILAAEPEDVDGRIHYVAACLYAQLGETDLAFECMEKSLDKGYGDLYDWKEEKTANFNVAPLRSDTRFELLLISHSYLFK